MNRVIEIVPYGGLPCEAQEFTVNGVDADKSDFGQQLDLAQDSAEDYACGSNQFVPFESVDAEVLRKYNISEEDYRWIQTKLEGRFYVGSCGWCV